MSQVQLDDNRTISSEPILKVSNLSTVFHKQQGAFGTIRSLISAVSDISFEIRESEILCVVGESGSGKTTLAKNVFCLSKPTSGSIEYKGIEITNLRGKGLLNYRRDVQMIYQDPFESLNPRHDVYTTIAMPLRHLRGEKDHEKIVSTIRDLLREVELDPDVMMHRYPHELSGGQRQRINIARALATGPKLLIADEPITMLDAAQRLRMLSLLLDLKKRRNLTILLITHDLASARLIGDKVLVMYRGKQVERGETKTVLSAPQHPYVQLIMESMPSLDSLEKNSNDAEPDEPAATSSDSADNPASAVGCVFGPRCKYATNICEQQTPPFEEKESKGHFSACFNPLHK